MSLSEVGNQKVRVAVVGAGDFGRNHARVYRELEDAELVGIVDADALPTSERPSPAAPSAVTAAALVVHFRFAACFTCCMVAFSAC